MTVRRQYEISEGEKDTLRGGNSTTGFLCRGEGEAHKTRDGNKLSCYIFN